MMHCSVIIPHFNQTDHLINCLKALVEQDCEGINYETIVVDNGSDENIQELVKGFKLKLLRVNDSHNPYACRNFGIQNSQGKVLAFLDAKCIPSQSWLKQGIDRIADFDIVAGEYDIKSNEKLSSKVFPLMYLNTKRNVQMKYGVTTGNLFVKRQVFDFLGNFETTSMSGNDILFTKKAMSEGFSIGLAEGAKVNYPNKGYHSLMSDIKKYGVGSSHTGQKSLKSVFPYLMPMRKGTMNSAIKYRNFEFSLTEKVRLWFYIWGAKIQFAFGIIQGVLPFSSKDNGNSIA